MEEKIHGLNYLISLSYVAIDRSDESAEVKRNLAFSVYSFGLLFESGEMTNPNNLVIKNRACYIIRPNEHPLYNENKEYFDSIKTTEHTFVTGGGVTVGEFIKFDAGGYLWRKCVDSGLLSGGDRRD